MKHLNPEVIRVLRRASTDDAFAEAVISDPERALRLYDLESADLDYIRSFRSKDNLSQEYKEYRTVRVDNRTLFFSGRVVDIYFVPGIIYILVLVAFIWFSASAPELLRSLGLPLWNSWSGTLRLVLIIYGLFFALFVLLKLYSIVGRLGQTARVAVLIGAVIFFFIPGSVFIGTLTPTARVAIVQILLVLLFTILPASLYSLFISTKGKSLWDEFVVNLRRLDPVGSEQLLPIYVKKFSALYGSPDQSGFGSALLQGEASFPVLLATFMVGLGWILFFSVVESGQIADALVGGFVSPFTFGFLGAYLFSLQMLFRRYVQADLKSVAYTHISQRILLTWVWTFVLNIVPWTKLGVTTDDRIVFVSVLAFMVGIFPDIAWQVIKQFVQRLLSIPLPSFREQYPLHEIDGITIWLEARLLEEDVENVENLITAGIVDLMLRTNLKPERIVHWIDQGVLRLHLGLDKKSALQQSLREHGIITATDLVYAYKVHKTAGRNAREGISRVFLSEQLDPLVRNLVVAIEDDPNMYHVLAWRELNATRRTQLPEAVKAQIKKESQPLVSAEAAPITPAVEIIPQPAEQTMSIDVMPTDGKLSPQHQ